MELKLPEEGKSVVKLVETSYQGPVKIERGINMPAGALLPPFMHAQ